MTCLHLLPENRAMIAVMGTALVQRQGIPFRADSAALAAENHRSTMRMLFAMTMRGRGKNYTDKSAEQIVHDEWPDDALAALLTRTAMTPTSTTNSGLPVLTAIKLLPGVAPMSAATRLFAQAGLKLNFAGRQQYSIPYFTALPPALFVGEDGAWPVVQPTLAAMIVNGTRKFGFMFMIANELAERAIEDAFELFSFMVERIVRLALDTAVFSTAAGTAKQPPGLLYGTTGLTPVAGGGLTALIGDLKQLIGALAASGSATDNAVIITHPEQAEVLGTLPPQPLKHAVYGTAGVPVGTVIMVDPSAVVTGYDGNADIYRSRDASAHMEDSAPQQLVAAGSPPVVAAPVISAFQQDSELQKVVVKCAWGVRPGAIQWLSGCTW